MDQNGAFTTLINFAIELRVQWKWKHFNGSETYNGRVQWKGYANEVEVVDPWSSIPEKPA